MFNATAKKTKTDSLQHRLLCYTNVWRNECVQTISSPWQHMGMFVMNTNDMEDIQRVPTVYCSHGVYLQYADSTFIRIATSLVRHSCLTLDARVYLLLYKYYSLWMIVHAGISSISYVFSTLKVIKETEEFERSLKEMQYLQRDSTDLLKYAKDVNCHFASKKCKDVIVAARKLMTSKMHNTVRVCLHVSVVLVVELNRFTTKETSQVV